MPNYVVLQAVLKEKLIGTGSGNLSELRPVESSDLAGFFLVLSETVYLLGAALLGGVLA